MIDYEKLLSFCLKQGMNNEEVFLLHSLFKVSNQEVNLIPKIKQYYSVNKDRGMKFIDIAEGLEERGLLTILKRNPDGGIDFKNLQITEEFKNLLFISDKEEIFERLYKMYPAKGVSPDGYSYFTANLIKTGDKEYFNKEVLKGMNKHDVDRMLYNISEMFDIDANGKPQNFAKVGFNTFIRNIHEIIRQWEEEQNSNSGNWNSKVY